MSEDIRSVLSELIDVYGIAILEDPDRLSQFLEERCGDQAEAAFYLTFALRHLLKGDKQISGVSHFSAEHEEELCQRLGFTREQARCAVDTINTVIADKSGNTASAPVASPGNLRKISGGISGRPRSMRLRGKSIYNSILLLAAFIVLGVLFFQIGTQRSPVGDELRIAFFAPMSGPDAMLSQVQLRAAQLAVERVNLNGPIKSGYKLKVVGFDLPKENKRAEAAVRAAMKDRSFLVMMLAANNGNIAELAALADSIEAPLVVISPYPPSGDELLENGLPYLYIFSLVNDAASRGKLLSYFATQALHKKRAAIYYDSSDGLSKAVGAAARKWIIGFGSEIAAELSYSGGSHTSAMRAVAESGADLLIITASGRETASIVSDARDAGFANTILGEGYSDSMVDAAGESLGGSWWINDVSELDPPIRSVLREYRSLYNENCPPDNISAAILSYDGVRWIASALQNAPGFRGEAIRHALLSTKNLPLTHATLTIDPRSHIPLNKAMAVIYCSKDKGIFQRRIRINKD